MTAALGWVVAIIVALIGVGGTVWVASRNRRAQVEDRTLTETGSERQFLVEKFNELADGFEKRWREADAKWVACEEREAALRRDLDRLKDLLRKVGQHLTTDEDDDENPA